MKSNKVLLIALSILLAVPFFNSCKRGDNDPFISFKARDSRISAVWELESGYSDEFSSQDEEFRWLDDDCEDAIDGLGNPLMEEYRETDVQSKTFNYSDALVNYNLLSSTTRDLILDPAVGIAVQGKEYEDAWTITRDINYYYELTIKKNGEYRVYVTYNLFDHDVPLHPDQENDQQYGKTYSGTFEYVDNWHWTDNTLGTKEGIQFDGFPLPVVNIQPQYDDDFNFFNNWVTGISFDNSYVIFEIDKLMSKELTLVGISNENSFYQEVDNEFEAYAGGAIDCEGTFTYTSIKNTNYYFQFVSDGKSVSQ